MFVNEVAKRDASVEDGITTLQAHLNAGMAELLSYVARLEKEDIWARWSGVRSAEDWVAWRLGLTRAESCRYVETAVKLEELPDIKDAFSKGEFSFEQIATICTVATPDTQETMLTLLRFTTAVQLRRICAAYLREVSSMDAAVSTLPAMSGAARPSMGCTSSRGACRLRTVRCWIRLLLRRWGSSARNPTKKSLQLMLS